MKRPKKTQQEDLGIIVVSTNNGDFEFQTKCCIMLYHGYVVKVGVGWVYVDEMNISTREHHLATAKEQKRIVALAHHSISLYLSCVNYH